MDSTTLIIIAVVGGLLLLAIVGGVLLFFLLGSDDEPPKKKPKSKSKKKIVSKRTTAKKPQPIDDDEDEDDDEDDDEFDEDDDEDDDEFDEDEDEDKDELTPPKQPAEPVSTSTPVQDLADLDDDKIRILVVDDNPDTRENVSRLLYFEKDMEVIGDATNGREGIEEAIRLKPHIVIMDINMPDVDGITATREMALKAPFSQVIIMSVQAEAHYMRQAMAAGARDFQPKPFTAEELVGSIRRVYKVGLSIYQEIEAAERYQQQQQQSLQSLALDDGDKVSLSDGRPPVIAVYSPKGGLGTSTIAINLAVALQQEYGNIILVDGDLQFGDISVHLNTKPRRTMSDIVEEGLSDLEILSDLALPHQTGIKLLLAPPQPEFADEMTPELLTDILNGLRQIFTGIVVDTTAMLTDKTLSVLDTADYILVVTSPELPAIKSSKQFLELADQLELDPDRIGVVINRLGLPGGLKNTDQIETALTIDETFRIPHDPKMQRATRRGAAVVQTDPTTPSTKAIKEMAQEIWQLVGITVENDVA